jgi:signal transduction histidine kinase
MEDQAARIERFHDVPIEVVTVGDCPMDDRLQPLVQAAGEAMANASKHARVSRVSVYVEVEPDAVTAFVRDQGRGFDLESVPPDRRGIADSIRGRMERAGGEAVVDTTVGEGTEVRLRLPREER